MGIYSYEQHKKDLEEAIGTIQKWIDYSGDLHDRLRDAEYKNLLLRSAKEAWTEHAMEGWSEVDRLKKTLNDLVDGNTSGAKQRNHIRELEAQNMLLRKALYNLLNCSAYRKYGKCGQCEHTARIALERDDNEKG